MTLTRKDRVRLLLQTYRDAMSPGRNQADGRGAFGSRPPATTQIYHEGSYYELGRALDRLRLCKKIYVHTIGFYCDHEQWSRKAVAEKGLVLLMEMMPRNIYVPQEISENAGYLGEAKSATRPGQKVAR